MDTAEILQELEGLAEKLNARVRYETGDFKGGLCRVNDEHVIIIPKKIPEELKVSIIARALGTFDLSDIYIVPLLRETISRECSPSE